MVSKDRSGVQQKISFRGNTKSNKGTKLNTRNKDLNQYLYKNKFLSCTRIAILISVLSIVFYTPYLRGLFFEPEQLKTEIFVFIIFIVFWISKLLKRDKHFLETPIDYAAFGFVIVYFISIFVAVDKHAAISEWLKYCMYFAIFSMISELIVTYKLRIILMWTIIASGTGMSILGIDGAAGGNLAATLNGIFKKTGLNISFFETFISGRISSMLQYSNAFATYIMVVFFISIGILVVSDKIYIKAIAAGLSFLFLLTFIFTYSKGAYIVISITSILLLLIIPKGNKIKVFVNMFYLIMITVLFSYRFYNYIQKPSENIKNIWFLVIVGMCVCGLLALCMNYFLHVPARVSWKVYFGIITSCSILIIFILLYCINTSVPLHLTHAAGQVDNTIWVQKKIILEPGREYKLQVNLNATISDDRPYSYAIDVQNLNEKDILISSSTNLNHLQGKNTRGFENKDLLFKVPVDSKVVNFVFSNYYTGTSVTFAKASIVDAKTGKLIENIKLKNKYLPDAIISIFEGVQVSNSTLIRSIYYRDGIKILKDHLFFGWGGSAWNRIYKSYQSYYYTTQNAHNYFLQIAIECGILGIIIVLMIFIAIIFMFLSQKLNKYVIEPKTKILKSIFIISIVAMFAHSAIDFDLSLPSVFLLLWVIIALFNSGWKEEFYKNKESNLVIGTTDNNLKILILKIIKKIVNSKQLYLNPIVGMVIVAFVIIVPISIVTARVYHSSAEKELSQNDIEKAIMSLKKAADTDIFRPEYKIDYANLLVLRKNINDEDISLAKCEISKAESLSKYRGDLLSKIGQFYLNLNEIDKGLGCFDREIILEPLVPEAWENRIKAYKAVAINYLQNQNNINGLKMIDKTLALIGDAKEVNKRNIIPFIFNIASDENLERVKFIKDNINANKQIDLNKLVFYSLPKMDIDSNGIPDQWVDVDISKTRFEVSEENLIVNSSSPVENSFITSRELNFQGNKSYKIQMELKGGDNLKEISFELTGFTKKVETFKKQGDFYLFNFSLPADFKSNSNKLKIYIKNKMEIKSILITEIS